MTAKKASQPQFRADAGRLASIPEAQAMRFHQALAEAGYLPGNPNDVPEVLEARSRGGYNLPRLLRLTSAEQPLDVFARLFLLGVPVGISAARSAMKSVPLEEWCDAGLTKITGEFVEGSIAIGIYEGLLLATEKSELLDHGAEADFVGSITNSTASLARFMVTRPFERVLDICTGCGVLGLISARRGGRVFATDLNPRAIQFAQFNAKLNGIGNIEFAVGSTFEPAHGEQFDLITANPPCVLGPSMRYQFRDSGQDLDSLCRQILAEAPHYLREGGLFQSTIEWPNLDNADWRKRATEMLQNLPADSLLMHLRTKDVHSHTEETIGDTDVLDLEEQARLYSTHMDYFQSRSVTSISEGLVALRRRSGASKNWMNLESLPNRAPLHLGDAVYQYFEVSDALDRVGNELLDIKLRMAPSFSIDTSRTWDGTSWDAGSYWIRQGSGFEFEATVDASIANLLRRCDGTKPLRELIAALAADANVSFDAVAAGCLKVIRATIQRGFLVMQK
jgi:protein-L-isoaspartate O-methyltransferase